MKGSLLEGKKKKGVMKLKLLEDLDQLWLEKKKQKAKGKTPDVRQTMNP